MGYGPSRDKGTDKGRDREREIYRDRDRDRDYSQPNEYQYKTLQRSASKDASLLTCGHLSQVEVRSITKKVCRMSYVSIYLSNSIHIYPSISMYLYIHVSIDARMTS